MNLQRFCLVLLVLGLALVVSVNIPSKLLDPSVQGTKEFRVIRPKTQFLKARKLEHNVQTLQPMFAEVRSGALSSSDGTDVNDIRTLEVDLSACVPEDSPIGFTLGQIFVLEADGTQIDGDWTFEITSGLEYVAIGGRFADEVTVSSVYDYESMQEFSFEVSVHDNAQGGKRVLQEIFNVCIEDLNDSSPYNVTLSNNVIQENMPAGSIVGLVHFDDADTVNSFQWALGGEDSAKFTVVNAVAGDPKTGYLKTNVMLDYEEQKVHRFQLGVSDGVALTLAPFVVYVTDANDNVPQDITLDQVPVLEGSPSGTYAGALSFVDLDSHDTFTVTVDGTDGSQFELSESGFSDVSSSTAHTHHYELTTTKELDYNDGKERLIEIIVCDGVHTVTTQHTIEVVNVNNHPITDVTLSSTSVTEDTLTGSTVATIGFTDPDGSDSINPATGATTVYTAYFTDGDGGPFRITGMDLVLLEPLDFETTQSYELDITVSDGLYSTSASFTITVEDVNDNPPTDPSITNTEIDVWSPVGTIVATVFFSDVDTIGTYDIVLSDEVGALALDVVDTFSAHVVTSTAFVYADLSTTLQTTVTVSDGLFTVTKEFDFIFVNDDNTAPYGMFLDNTHITEANQVGALVGVLTFNDDDVYTSTSPGATATTSTSPGATATTSTSPGATAATGTSSTSNSATTAAGSAATRRLLTSDMGAKPLSDLFTLSVTTVATSNGVVYGTEFYFDAIQRSAETGTYKADLRAAESFNYEDVQWIDIAIDLVDPWYSPEYILQLQATIQIDNIDDEAPDNIILGSDGSHLQDTSDSVASVASSSSSPVITSSAPVLRVPKAAAGKKPQINGWQANVCEQVDCGSQVCQANDGQMNYRCVDYLTLRDDEGDWSLLRRAAPKNSSNEVNVWHNASDNMMGSDVYGKYGSSACSFSARFDDKDFDEFLFATGDGSAWMVVDSQKLRDLDVDRSFGVTGTIEASLNSLASYETQWWNRGDQYPQDPILYYGDNSNTMLYAEAGMEADELFAKVDGYNVYGRWRKDPSSTS